MRIPLERVTMFLTETEEGNQLINLRSLEYNLFHERKISLKTFILPIDLERETKEIPKARIMCACECGKDPT